MRAANVIVNLFPACLPQRSRDVLGAVMNAIFSLCIVIATRRLVVGGMGAYQAGDDTMFLVIPLWWENAVTFVAFRVRHIKASRRSS